MGHPRPARRLGAMFDRDDFLIEQKLTAMVNRYSVREPPAPDGHPGALLAFCQQKRLAMKEDLRFFADEAMTTELMRIKARKVIDIGGRYDVTDAEGALIGTLERRAKRSLLRTTWAILGPDGQELAWLQERSMAIAVVRRIQNLLQVLPFGGLLLDLIPIPYHFDFHSGDEIIGHQTRAMGFRDRYRLTLDGDPDRRIDRRLAVAMGVGLDALQSR